MGRRPEHRSAVGLGIGLVLLVGCHSGSQAPAPTTSSPSTTSAPTPAATSSPAAQLQQLAAAGAGRRYHATYAVHQRRPSSSATWVVWRTPSALRVDVVTGRVTTTLIRTSKAAYSCRKSRGRRTCFRVARGGKPIPTPFRLSAEQLFSGDVTALATRTSAFVVSSAAADGAPGVCFRVIPRQKAQSVGKAVYCFNDVGILSAIRYPNGNVVRLRHAVVTAPQRKAFVPYSSPTPLPS